MQYSVTSAHWAPAIAFYHCAADSVSYFIWTVKKCTQVVKLRNKFYWTSGLLEDGYGLGVFLRVKSLAGENPALLLLKVIKDFLDFFKWVWLPSFLTTLYPWFSSWIRRLLWRVSTNSPFVSLIVVLVMSKYWLKWCKITWTFKVMFSSMLS